MARPIRLVEIDYEGDIAIGRLRKRRLDETEVQTIGEEFAELVEKKGCRKLVISLGPGAMECLYSVFVAKLVGIQRRVQEHNGALIICDVAPEVMTIFAACKLQDYFEFAPDRVAALAAMKTKSLPE